MEIIKLGDACEILNGYAFKSENYVDSGIRVIRIANVQKGFIEDNTPAFYPLESKGLDKYMLEEGDLLMSLTYLLHNVITEYCRTKWRMLHLQNGENCRGYQ